MAPDPLCRDPLETLPLEPPRPWRLAPPSVILMSPVSSSLTTAGLSAALGVIWPDFAGPRKSFFPPGRGTLRGFLVLLVISILFEI